MSKTKIYNVTYKATARTYTYQEVKKFVGEAVADVKKQLTKTFTEKTEVLA